MALCLPMAQKLCFCILTVATCMSHESKPAPTPMPFSTIQHHSALPRTPLRGEHRQHRLRCVEVRSFPPKHPKLQQLWLRIMPRLHLESSQQRVEIIQTYIQTILFVFFECQWVCYGLFTEVCGHLAIFLRRVFRMF